MFKIDVDDLHWINDNPDEPEDLCAHGHVIATIGTEIFDEYATVSSTAIYLLKTIELNHFIGEENQMLPCCGHTMIANDSVENGEMVINVVILGCDNGTDWSVMHEEDFVRLITQAGNETLIPIDEYRETVFKFADKVEAFYKNCSEKILPKDAYDRNGYIAMWNEWKRRRYEK